MSNSGINPVSGISIRRIAAGRAVIGRSGLEQTRPGLTVTESTSGQTEQAVTNYSRGTGVIAMPLAPVGPVMSPVSRSPVVVEPLPAHSVLGRGAGVY